MEQLESYTYSHTVTQNNKNISHMILAIHFSDTCSIFLQYITKISVIFAEISTCFTRKNPQDLLDEDDLYDWFRYDSAVARLPLQQRRVLARLSADLRDALVAKVVTCLGGTGGTGGALGGGHGDAKAYDFIDFP